MANVVVESLRSSLMLERYPKMIISVAINVINSSGDINFDIGLANMRVSRLGGCIYLHV